MSLPDRRDRPLELLLPAASRVGGLRADLPQADVEMVDMAEFLQAQADFELVPLDDPSLMQAPTAEGPVAPPPEWQNASAASLDLPAWQIAPVDDLFHPSAAPSHRPAPVARPSPALDGTDAAVTTALLESERLDEAESALAAADAAVLEAEQALQRLRRVQSEQRLRTDAQRSRTIQARLVARTLSLRHTTPPRPGAGPEGLGAGLEPPRSAADEYGFQPTLPFGDNEDTRAVLREASILTVMPTQRRAWEDAANRPRMGTVLVEGQRLTPLDVEMVLLHQSTQQRRFGEIAVALGLLEMADVVWALRHQEPDAQPASASLEMSRPEPRDVLVIRDDPDGDAARVIRDIAGQVVERSRGNPVPQALAIVSPSVGDGKSTLAANLAMALAERGRRVLLIDTDVEGSRLHRMLPGLPPSGGLASVMRGEQSLGQAIVQPPAWNGGSGLHGLYLLPATGPASREAPALASADMARHRLYVQIVERAVEHYDHVLLDTPAASRGPATRRLARLAGTAMVVARPGRTPSASLDSLALELKRAGAAVLGVVMNSH